MNIYLKISILGLIVAAVCALVLLTEDYNENQQPLDITGQWAVVKTKYTGSPPDNPVWYFRVWGGYLEVITHANRDTLQVDWEHDAAKVWTTDKTGVVTRYSAHQPKFDRLTLTQDNGSGKMWLRRDNFQIPKY